MNKIGKFIVFSGFFVGLLLVMLANDIYG